MITLDSPKEEKTFMIPQEEHADLAAQFAAHWGNKQFAKLVPYDTMVFAAIYHDSQYREVEADLPIDLDSGRPHGHRTTPAAAKKLDSLLNNIQWVGARNPYASLIVSMHHTGLAQNRYGVINSWQNTVGNSMPKRPLGVETETVIRDLEGGQRSKIASLEKTDPDAKRKVWLNYRLFQVFDLMSLYFCSDGHTDKGLKEVVLGPIPLSYDGVEETNIKLAPLGDNVVRLTPYPFDQAPLQITIFGRTVRQLKGHSEADCRAEYFNAPRGTLSWTITN